MSLSIDPFKLLEFIEDTLPNAFLFNLNLVEINIRSLFIQGDNARNSFTEALLKYQYIFFSGCFFFCILLPVSVILNIYSLFSTYL